MSSYDYMYAMEEMAEMSALSGMLQIPSMLLSIASYVLSALALYTLAQRRGLNKPWLAWIPVANIWILGSLSDQYRYLVRRENKSKRKVLLTLSILNIALTVAMLAGFVAMVVNVVSGSIYGIPEEAILEGLIGPVIAVLGLAVPMLGISIAYTIIRYMALFDIYKSVDPSNSVLFLVLSILFGISEPFFLFFSRNKDLGMPPRRPQPAYYAPQQSYQPPQQSYQPPQQRYQPPQQSFQVPEQSYQPSQNGPELDSKDYL